MQKADNPWNQEPDEPKSGAKTVAIINTAIILKNIVNWDVIVLWKFTSVEASTWKTLQQLSSTHFGAAPRIAEEADGQELTGLAKPG